MCVMCGAEDPTRMCERCSSDVCADHYEVFLTFFSVYVFVVIHIPFVLFPHTNRKEDVPPAGGGGTPRPPSPTRRRIPSSACWIRLDRLGVILRERTNAMIRGMMMTAMMMMMMMMMNQMMMMTMMAGMVGGL